MILILILMCLLKTWGNIGTLIGDTMSMLGMSERKRGRERESIGLKSRVLDEGA